MPFDDDDDTEIKGPVRKISLKKVNPPQPERPSTKEIFEQQAEQKFSQIEDYKQKIWDLSIKYKSFIESKILPENRGPITSNLEKEVLDKLVQLSLDMNEDETQEQGVGSTALCMLLMKCMLIQRDIINSLNFKLEQIEQKIKTNDKNI